MSHADPTTVAAAPTTSPKITTTSASVASGAAPHLPSGSRSDLTTMGDTMPGSAQSHGASSTTSRARMAPTKSDPAKVAKPAYFFPLNNHPTKSEEEDPEPIPDEIVVMPEDDPGALRGIPVFKPTMDEFRQFDVYMETVVPWGLHSSIVKIIPPQEWVDAVELIDHRAMSELQIKSPIEQVMVGKNGVFVQRNVERMRNRPLSIQEWFNKCGDFPTPSPLEADRTLDRDSKDAKEWRAQRAAQIKAEKETRRQKRIAAAARKEERRRSEALKPVNDAATEQNSSSFTTPPDMQNSHEDADDLPGLETSSHTSNSTGDPLVTTPHATPPPDAFYESADFHKDWLPDGVSEEDFTVRGCVNIEKKFWKTIGIGKSSWYGADLAGSLFADPKTPWNVAHLPNLLQRMKNRLPGVNTPYLYFGMWRAAFSWHVEDMDLFSINYIHFGAPKFWYAVPQSDSERFETVTKSYFPTDANHCDQFMRHKSCTLSPTRLNQEGIRVNKLVQKQNEFVITFPRGYHAGFNMGFNCAESVNFALPCWLDIGRKAKACTCVNHSVRIDVDQLLVEPEPEPEVRESPKKRKAEGTTPAVRKRRPEPAVKAEEPSLPKAPVIRLRIPAPVVIPITEKPGPAVTRPVPDPPCVLCPSLAEVDLAPVHEPSAHMRSLARVPTVQAHISCAIAVPEAYTQEVIEDGNPVLYVMGLDNIGKDRWNLKCSACVDKRAAKAGTKIQCTKGKCVRAYHVPCARDNPDVLYWAGDKEIDGQSSFAVELLCPGHNPEAIGRKKNQAAEELRSKIVSMPIGSPVKIKQGGCGYAAQLVHVIEGTRRAVVQMLDGTTKEVAWTAFDFRPSQVHMLENEYARPPKKSRKVQPEPILAAPELPSPPVISPQSLHRSPLPVHDIPAKHEPVHRTPQPHPSYHPDPKRVIYSPPQPKAHIRTSPVQQYIPSSYYPPGPAYPPSHNVVLVDAHHQYHPPPAPYSAFAESKYAQGPPPPFGPGARPILSEGGSRTLPVSCTPRSLPPPGRLMSYSAHIPRSPISAPLRVAALHPTHSAPGGYARPMSGHGQAGAMGPPQFPPARSVPPTTHGVGKIDLTLDRMRALNKLLPPFSVPAIHLAGTNGKGSTSTLLEAVLMNAGFTTARYNSPFLLEPYDAVRINGQPITRDRYLEAIHHVEQVAKDGGLQPTAFELATSAMYYIANTHQPPLDILIVEAGIGGVRDATNVLPPDMTLASVLTSVGLDHTDRLGNTLAAIAREKSLIAVPGGVLVAGCNIPPEALQSAQQAVSERGAALIQARKGFSLMNPIPSNAPPVSEALVPYTKRHPLSLQPFKEPAPVPVRVFLANRTMDVLLSLGGKHQIDNVSLALTILDVMRNDRRALGIQPKLASLKDVNFQLGVTNARWAGRCSWLQWRDPSSSQVIPLLADGAHNTDSSTTLANYLDSLGLPAGRARTFVLSLSESPGKSPESVLSPLLRAGDRVAVVQFTTPVADMPWIQTLSKPTVEVTARSLVGETGEVYVTSSVGPESVAEGLRWAHSDWHARGPGLIVVCGSLYLVADVYRLLQQ